MASSSTVNYTRGGNDGHSDYFEISFEVTVLDDEKIYREVIETLSRMSVDNITFHIVPYIVRALQEKFRRLGYCISDDRIRKIARDVVRSYNSHISS